MKISVQARRRIAGQCGVSDEYLYQLLTGRKKTVRAELLISIEKESAGAIRCEDLCPTADWSYLRGTGATTDLANTQPATPAPSGSDIATAAAGQGA